MDETIRATATDVVDSTIPESDRAEYTKRIAEDGGRKWSFTVVDGFFKQSSLETDAEYDPNDDHFGRVLPTWKDVVKRVKELNENSDDNVKYKLIFCARHGEGYHNVAVEKFGLSAWDEHYSKLPGAIDPETGEYMRWGPDPDLTDRGYGQARVMRKLVEREIDDGMPIPESFYVSPFTRSCETLKTTWDKNRGEVLVVELLRETIGEHLCDKRSKKSEIEKKHDNSGWKFKFEDDFTEDDELFREDWRENVVDVAIRANSFLQKLFDKNEQIVWCCTHSGQIRGMIIASGHRSWTIPTAGMIPIVVKGVKI
ncbi:hypothetical protein CANINC_004347 [Pichia inconspicua]|uniref:Phosphoglycerate mutase n=1 Tax=Pichia inconspicua TaxID=52247 RepID=A0A4V4NF84_9ASCO|nr:hypothetical protein CANINC_004347 [[Candida] inconspicua]